MLAPAANTDVRSADWPWSWTLKNVPAHGLIARNFAAWTHAVKKSACAAAGVPKPKDVATFVLTVMEGGVMQARVFADLAHRSMPVLINCEFTCER